MRLWFENSFGDERIIADPCDTWEEVNQSIQYFLDECKRKWPDKKPFEWYYTRIWMQDDGRTCIDIGSHTEFFIWEGRIKSMSTDPDSKVEFEYDNESSSES